MSNEIHEYVLVPLNNLVPFSGTLYDEKGNQTVVSGNPFFVPENASDDKELNRLHASIEQEGILTPLLVRPAGQENFYEILSGYRIKKVCEELAKTKPEFQNVPVIIITVDEIKELIENMSVKERKVAAKRKFSLDYALINPYCEGMTDQKVEALIYELIEQWGRASEWEKIRLVR